MWLKLIVEEDRKMNIQPPQAVYIFMFISNLLILFSLALCSFSPHLLIKFALLADAWRRPTCKLPSSAVHYTAALKHERHPYKQLPSSNLSNLLDPSLRFLPQSSLPSVRPAIEPARGLTAHPEIRSGATDCDTTDDCKWLLCPSSCTWSNILGCDRASRIFSSTRSSLYFLYIFWLLTFVICHFHHLMRANNVACRSFTIAHNHHSCGTC